MIDWNDNAKAAVREFVEYVDEGDCFSVAIFPLVDKFLESRPTQTKTVADAVEQEKHWRYDRLPFLAWNSITNKFVYGSSAKCAPHEQYVCTRAEFKAYVKEQEGEKWTHETAESEYCRILIDKPDQFGNVVILKEDWGYSDYPLSSLKPIKPTISKAHAWDKVASEDLELSVSVSAIKDQYNII